MNEYRQFCCVECGELLDNDEAEHLFRTGFYRVSIPLGYCRKCQKAAQELQDSHPKKDDKHTLNGFAAHALIGQPQVDPEIRLFAGIC